MKLPEYSIKYKAVVLFTMVMLVVGGLSAYFKLGKLEDPVFTIKTAVIVTAWPGASPHDVEQQVTDVIEKAAQSADEVDEIHSISQAGLSLVFVDLNEKNRTAQVQQLWDMLRRKVNGVQGELPRGAMPSRVVDDYGDVYGIFLALTGEGYTNAELKKYADYLKRELLLVEDVSRIQLFGDRTQAVYVEISRSRIANLGIHPARILEILSSQNKVLDAGSVETETRRIRVATPGDFKSIEEIENLVIQAGNGESFLLKDLATVTKGYVEPPEPMMRFNGVPAIGIAISAAHGANVVTMGDAVQKRIDELMADLPVGVDLQGIYYQSTFVKGAIKSFVINLLESVAIVVGVLLITMGIRSGLLIASGLVLSILGTLVVMLFFGIDLQRISLAALILVMGMIVDNSIVVTDGSLVYLQKRKDRLFSMVTPAMETAWPLLGATFIACLAFMPIYLSPTNSGEYCASLFQVVAVALLLSWVLAMCQAPVFNHMLLKVNKGATEKDPHGGRAYKIYRWILDFSLGHRILVLVLLVLLMVSSGMAFKHVPKMFFADSDKAQFFIDYWLPQGARIEQVSSDLKEIEAHLAQIPEIKNYAATIGSGGPRYITSIEPETENPAYGQLIVNVHDYKKIRELIPTLETWIAAHFPDADPQFSVYINGPSADFKVEARFSGPDPLVLRELSQKAKGIMTENPNAKNIRDDWRQRVQVLTHSYSQNKARKAGVEREHLANAMKQIHDGLPVSYFREDDNLIPVCLKVSSQTAPLAGLDNTPVWGQGDRSVPLDQIVTSSDITWEDPLVRRYNRRRAITAQCDTVPGITSDSLFNELRPLIEAIPLPKGYTLEWDGEYDLSKSGNEGVQKTFPLALLLMVFILVVLFNGFRQPLIIALLVPFAVVGIAFGLFVTGESFGFLALLGAYSLIGMLIKNAVVLIDQIDLEIREGKDPLAAVKDSCMTRMRPVMMASATTILGMIPLMTDPMFSSMAVTIMFGLAFATILTLIVVPVLYTLFFRIKTASA
ncbi:MAG: efflux RND transporter permease subunit [Desulfobacteraceae bacterium]|nr:efflux RND transporter permease subunit [Desulfobacteraceae bacterium]